MTTRRLIYHSEHAWAIICYFGYGYFFVALATAKGEIHPQVKSESLTVDGTVEGRYHPFYDSVIVPQAQTSLDCIIGALLSRFVFNMRQVYEVRDIGGDTDKTQTIIVTDPDFGQELRSHIGISPATSWIRTSGALSALGNGNTFILSDDDMEDDEAHDILHQDDEHLDIDEELVIEHEGSNFQSRQYTMSV
ncbi:hypothetical protein WOLCODRAFT_144781 [Wolfiporia cocos MD-104 SS10]|uniref:Uncharacterized protein n=1 Tax=Wolfiporia cocos (strain MD-104) TaxID=742152 RepID=A0A2H3JYJ3_WOLCO|nr:hypothetical protein WOLCODRAFT_144781 [Wolfiporia cocos MD-104 SS10]